jgi:hypothetical protein
VSRRNFVFESVLAEAAVTRRSWEATARFERTTRPEEERLLSPFRSARPHGDENIVGITRWITTAARASRTWYAGGFAVEPFAEIGHSWVTETTGSIFDPVEHYGSDGLWSLSFGARVAVGLRHARMGRYGVAVPTGMSHAFPVNATNQRNRERQ